MIQTRVIFSSKGVPNIYQYNVKADLVEVNLGNAVADKWVSITQFIKEPEKQDKKKKKKKKVTQDQKPPSKYTYIYNEDNLALIEYYKQMLDLFCQLCVGGNEEAISFIAKGDNAHPPLVTLDIAYRCMQDPSLPGTLRVC